MPRGDFVVSSVHVQKLVAVQEHAADVGEAVTLRKRLKLGPFRLRRRPQENPPERLIDARRGLRLLRLDPRGDVLALTGSCDDTHLQQILTAALPTGTPHADVLTGWLAPVAAGRLPQILAALRGRLGVPTTAPLSIPNPHALAGVMGDHRTDSLAHALIEARRQCEAALAEVMAAASPTTQQDDLQKSG